VEVNSSAWSPSGEKIAVEVAVSSRTRAIWTMKADGSDAQKLIEFPFRTFSGVDWSPDGSVIAYSALADNRMQIFTVPSTGGTPTQITHGIAHTLQPTFSPDGKHIAATHMTQVKEIWKEKIGTP